MKSNQLLLQVIGFFALINFALSTCVHADPICNTIEGCNELLQRVQLQIRELRYASDPSHAISHIHIARNPDHSLIYLPEYTFMIGNQIFQGAEEYCRGLGNGAHLANIYELSMKLNQAGISSTQRHPADVDIYWRTSPPSRNRPADFYYDRTVYHRFQGDIGENTFWSSTGTRSGENNGYGNYYIFRGNNGVIDESRDDHANHAVLCITN